MSPQLNALFHKLLWLWSFCHGKRKVSQILKLLGEMFEILTTLEVFLGHDCHFMSLSMWDFWTVTQASETCKQQSKTGFCFPHGTGCSFCSVRWEITWSVVNYDAFQSPSISGEVHLRTSACCRPQLDSSRIQIHFAVIFISSKCSQLQQRQHQSL